MASYYIAYTTFAPFDISVSLDDSVSLAGLGGCEQYPCNPGQACSYVNYSLSCEPCPENLVGVDGQRCTPCVAGVAPNNDQTSCEPCETGHYSAFGVCQECAAPNVVSVDNTSCIAPFLCNAGYECSNTNNGCSTQTSESNDCTPCPIGNVSSGGADCTSCDEPGKVANPEQSACVSCGSGRAPASDNSKCVNCTGATYSGFGIECEDCPEPNVVNAERTTCKKCDPGEQPNNGTACERCTSAMFSQFGVECAECPIGLRPAHTKDACEPCPRATFQRQGNYTTADQCPGTVYTAGTPCDTGYQGILCQSCALGYRWSHFGVCEDCMSSSLDWHLAAILLVVILVAVGACMGRTLRRRPIQPTTLLSHTLLDGMPGAETTNDDSSSDFTAQESIDHASDGFPTSTKTPWRLRCLGISELQVILRCAWQPLRIVITYFQVTSQLGAVLHVSYPDAFAAAMHDIKSWMDVFGYFFSPECSGLAGFANTWLLRVVCLPLALLSLAAGYYALERRLGTELSEARSHLRGNCFFVLFFCYPSICNICFSSFNCLPLEGSTVLTALYKRKSVLLVDDRRFCEEVYLYQVLSGVVIAVFGCGIPLIFGVLLLGTARAYKISDTDTRNTMHVNTLADEFETSPLTVTHMLRDLKMGSNYSFLMDAYKPVYLYWEVIDITRKLILVGFMVLVGAGSVWQVMISAMLCFIFFGMQVKHQPYKIEADNTFRMVTEAHVFITVLVALVSTNMQRPSSAALDTLLVGSFVLCVPVAWMVTTVIKLRRASFRVGISGAFARFQLGLASGQDIEQLTKRCKQTKVIVMSCPEMGTLNPDGGEPYDQEVMTKVMELQKQGVVKLGFDRAGSSNIDQRDDNIWPRICWKEQTQDLFEPDLKKRKELVTETYWFAGYKAAVKAQLKLECQNFDGILVVVCIKGGTITEVEHEEMGCIVEEATADAKLSNIECNIQLEKMSYFEFLQTYDKNIEEETARRNTTRRSALGSHASVNTGSNQTHGSSQ